MSEMFCSFTSTNKHIMNKEKFNYTEFIYTQYTDEDLQEIIAVNEHNNGYLNARAKECRLELTRRREAEAKLWAKAAT